MRKIFSLIVILSLFFTTLCSVSAETKKGRYEELLVERLGVAESLGGKQTYYFYEEQFCYYSDSDKATPDYVLIKASKPTISDGFIMSVFGEYIIITCGYEPYSHGYYIYTTYDDKIYTLEEAYYDKVPEIEQSLNFLTGTHVAMVGDADADNTLNIKDATWIQRYIVACHSLIENYNWDVLAYEACDFNRDGEVTIKDATAIQKYIAGLEY